jgi:apolipoprotein D and lipocalin family protein
MHGKGSGVPSKAGQVLQETQAGGALKVSFFGPFYASYNVVALDRENYAWALVCSNRKSLFWILARKPEMDPALLRQLVARADSLGFETGGLLYLAEKRP